jgi:hypothetical protein
LPSPRRSAAETRASSPHTREIVRVGGVLAIVKRTIHAVRLAATDTRIPKPLRWLAALGLAPLPGPFDEMLLVLVAVPLALFYRGPLADAWRRASSATNAGA